MAIDFQESDERYRLLADLVGRQQRVLDIGCGDGELGRRLRLRGCHVSGLELDTGAAEVAGRVLDEVVIGDVTELDLLQHFGAESFDAVVFADVLQYLADPVAVLRKAVPLLATSGAVVASVPNVGHGSVRLSLLCGRSDRRPLGLLDSSHLRFFSRGSLHAAFLDAGLVPVEMRRTTAGAFDVGIDIRREDFNEETLEAVEGDPDCMTHQFLVRAVRQQTPETADSDPGRRSAPARARIGLWAHWPRDDLRQALTVRVTGSELARRLPGGSVRSFSSSLEVHPSPHDGGLTVEALGSWSPERAGQLATELDCVVVTGPLPELVNGDTRSDSDPARFLLEGVGPQREVDCPVLWSAVRLSEPRLAKLDGSIHRSPYRAVLDDNPAINWSAVLGEPPAVIPDPLLLVPRILSSEALSARLELAQTMGWFPQEGPAVVVEVDGQLLPEAVALAQALEEAVSGSHASLVLIHLEPGDGGAEQVAEAISGAMTAPVYRLPSDVLVDDVVAVIANATVFLSCSLPSTALGLAYERAVAYLGFVRAPGPGELADVIAEADIVVRTPDELAHLLDDGRFRPTTGLAARLQWKLDAHFDRIAGLVERAAGARSRGTDVPLVLPPGEYVAALELAHRRMQQRLLVERQAVANQFVDLRRRLHEEIRRSKLETDSARRQLLALTARLDDMSGQRDRALAELAALRGTWVLRLLRPARSVYARLRGSRL